MNCINLLKRKNKPYCKISDKEISFKKCIGCKKKDIKIKQYKPLLAKTKLVAKKEYKYTGYKSKRAKKTNINQKIKKIVLERDKGICIICKLKQGLPNMHYIPRSKGGLGIEQNIACGCIECHHEYDNGTHRQEYGAIIKEHLKSKYNDWNEDMLIYKK